MVFSNFLSLELQTKWFHCKVVLNFKEQLMSDLDELENRK